MSEHYIERYWRDATPADAIKEPPMVARFRDHDCDDWEVSSLLGFSRSSEDFPWFNKKDSAYYYCQVYDAPDPGEGWRLIDVEKETPKTVDEVYANGSWLARPYPFDVDPYDKGRFYRRRIAQTVTYAPFTWEDREQLRGRWVVDRTGEQEYAIDDFLSDSGILYICGHPAEYFLNWRFLDTSEPVGKKVTE